MHHRFDQLAKGILRVALTPAGLVRTGLEITVDAQSADVWFEPDLARAAARDPLGLLGRIAADACMLEPFHATPRADQLRDCVRKLLSLHHRRRLDAERQGAPPPAFPRVWVIASSGPAGAVRGFSLARIRGWPAGCLEGSPELGLRLVVLRELPRTRSTLLLRLMGAGAVLRRAVEELARLPRDAIERAIALPELIARKMEMPQDAHGLTREEKDFMRSTDEIYEQWKQQVEAEGERKGERRGERKGERKGLALGLQEGLLVAYEARFGAVPAKLAAAITATLDPATLREWLGLVRTQSPQEIAEGILVPRKGRSSLPHKVVRPAR